MAFAHHAISNADIALTRHFMTNLIMRTCSNGEGEGTWCQCLEFALHNLQDCNLSLVLALRISGSTNYMSLVFSTGTFIRCTWAKLSIFYSRRDCNNYLPSLLFVGTVTLLHDCIRFARNPILSLGQHTTTNHGHDGRRKTIVTAWYHWYGSYVFTGMIHRWQP